MNFFEEWWIKGGGEMNEWKATYSKVYVVYFFAKYSHD